jgi:hypothetical protein
MFLMARTSRPGRQEIKPGAMIIMPMSLRGRFANA